MAGPSYSFTSSIASDSIDLPLSDCFPFAPSEATESQLTTPFICEPPLSSIERVGPDRIKKWALWSEICNDDFLEWWLTTEYGMKPKTEHPSWDKRGYTSTAWQTFNQVAHIETGQPEAICKVCGVIVDHPGKATKKGGKIGTNVLKRHMQHKCRGLGKGPKTQNLADLWQKAVSSDQREK